ncbi:septation protein SepH [Williamsia sp. CHRR-6]|uniref:septation protein SepH n=1 Tax=Williamsia sp. CHRR-6 TaxID=2835871 RepID=UPI001BD94FEF|nr:septation protein SepH [Williamsia sp. CHRR-6]MBT0566421.1 DUF3071 domain-containing protein [Williamsia sp. CHRR-6]
MRELRVIGVDADGGCVICQDVSSGEKFSLPADDRLRAAARGDISRLGQIEIEMESALRPREIQARIRAGASVAQVAAAAGVPQDKVARFAHPVLLERDRAAEMAAQAHPLRHDGPALSTLGEVVAAALGARGHNPDDTTWDAWKGEDNRWVVQVNWRAGRSENHAHWRYLPGSSGGIVEPLDESADELTDPDLSRPLRGIGSVVSLTPTPHTETVTVDADRVIGAQRARRHHEPEQFELVDQHAEPVVEREPDVDPFEIGSAEPEFDQDATVDEHHRDPTPPYEAPTEPIAHTPEPGLPTTAPASETTTPARRRKAGRKPAVPAWEDVLLGVRSNGHQ